MASPPPDFSDRPDPNPYVAGHYAGQPALGGPTVPSLPTFCTVYFIIDLIFSFLRAIMAMFGVVAMAGPIAQENAMVQQTVMYEVASGIGIALLGIPANFLMLFKKRIGAYLAGGKILFTLMSLAVGLWQMSFAMNQFPEGSPERIGAVIGALFAITIRLGLLGLYIGAIVTFWKWLNRQEEPPKPGFQV